jgi:hypothetical protein
MVELRDWRISPPQGRYLHRTTQTQNKSRETSMLWVGFEPTIPAFERWSHFLPYTARPLWLACTYATSLKLINNIYICDFGRTTAQAVRHWLLIAKPWVQYRVISFNLLTMNKYTTGLFLGSVWVLRFVECEGHVKKELQGLKRGKKHNWNFKKLQHY